MEHTNYYYDNVDGRRARMTVIDKVDMYRVRLAIRAERGQGALLLNKTYTTKKGARAALNRRGRGWTLYKTTSHVW